MTAKNDMVLVPQKDIGNAIIDFERIQVMGTVSTHNGAVGYFFRTKDIAMAGTSAAALQQALDNSTVLEAHRPKLLKAIGLLKARAFDLAPEGKSNVHQRLYEESAKNLDDLFDLLYP